MEIKHVFLLVCILFPLQDVAQLLLPEPYGSWPFNSYTGLSDVSGHNLHGVPNLASVASRYVSGPDGTPDSSLLVGSESSEDYITMAYPNKLNLNASSWTISAFVNAKGKDGPILEYGIANNGNYWGIHIWQEYAKLYVNPGGGSDSNTIFRDVTCTLPNWQFIAVTYNAPKREYRLYCNLTQAAILSDRGVAETSTGLFRVGKRIGLKAGTWRNSTLPFGQISCLQMFLEELTTSDLAQVKLDCLTKTRWTNYQTQIIASPRLGYWPLTTETGLSDLSGNNLHGVWASHITTPIFGMGPDGTESSSLKIGSGDLDYVHFEGPSFRLNESSWTISLFYNPMGQMDVPIIEYEKNFANNYEFHVWANRGQTNTLYLATMADGANETRSCDLTSWQFVAVSYDVATASYRFFCNDKQAGQVFQSRQLAVTNSGRFNLGKRIGDPTKPSMVSCFSIHLKALSDAELLQAKTSCPPVKSTTLPSTTAKVTTLKPSTFSTGTSLTTSGSQRWDQTTREPSTANEIPTRSTSLIVVSTVPAVEIIGPDPEMPKPTPWSRMTAKIAVQVCSYLSPLNRSPPPYTGMPLEVRMQFSIDRIHGVHNVEQWIKVTGQLYTKWSVFVCPRSATERYIRERVMVGNLDDIWQPDITFRNAFDDISMKTIAMYDRMEFFFATGAINSAFYFSWKKLGMYTASCSLDLAFFPFDTQQCGFTFTLLEPIYLVNITEAKLKIRLGITEGTSEWLIVKDGGISHVDSVVLDDQDQVSQATFLLTLKRRPDYYLFNLLGPCGILTLLSFTTFFIPPHTTDRSTFNICLVLTLFVCLAQVLAKVPPTSQRILLNDFIQLLTVICLWITVYSVGVLWFVYRYPEKALKRVFLKLSLARLLDVAAYLAAIVALIGITCYVVSQAKR